MVTEYLVDWGDGNSDTYFGAGDVAHTYTDGRSTPTITVDLVDEDGRHSGAGTLSLTVHNVVPTVEVELDHEVAVRGERITLTLAAGDVSSVDQDAKFRFDIDWDGDGVVDQTAPGPANVAVEHIYPDAGDFTVRVTATDKDEGRSEEVTHAIQISAVGEERRGPRWWNDG